MKKRCRIFRAGHLAFLLAVALMVSTVLTSCGGGTQPPEETPAEPVGSDVAVEMPGDGGGEEPPDVTVPNEPAENTGSNINIDEIMDKTPADFEGHEGLVVLGMNEDGKENFLVYAGGVTQGVSTGEENVVIEADAEAGVYVVKNPSEEIRVLGEGDVFIIPSTPESPLGAAVKIVSVTEGEDGIFTYTSGEVTIEEMYDYAYIKTPLMVYSMMVDENAQDETGSVELFGYTDDPTDRVVLSGGGTQGGFFDKKTEWEGTLLKAGLSVRQGLDFNFGEGYVNGLFHELHFKADMRVTLTEITGEFYHNPARGYIHIGVNFHSETSNENSWAYEGGWRGGPNGMGWTFPMAVGIIPYTPIPYAFETVLTTEISGGIGGKSTTTQSYVNSVGVDVFYYSRAEGYAFNEQTGSVETLNAAVTGKAETCVAFRLSVGIPSMTAIYGELGILGLRLEGTLNKELESDDPEPESVHDCERCIDGEFAIFGVRGRVGYVVGVPGGSVLNGHADLAELEIKDKAFYASLREDAPNGFEFGWGECPHRRYRATVTVLDEHALRTEGAQVTAKYPDLRTDHGETDEDGEVVLYLPTGDNLLGAKYQGQSGSTHAVVKNKPVTAVINMEDNGVLYINYPHNEQGNDTDSYPELRQQLETMFPEATFVTRGSVAELLVDGTIVPGDILLDVKYGAPEKTYGEWRDDNLSDGDDSNIWGESGGWVYIEARRVCKHDDGVEDTHCYFSFDITYDGPYKAWLANPKPVGEDAFRMTVNCDASPMYDEEFTLLGYYGDETGELPQMREVTRLPQPYTSDVQSVRALPSQRWMIVDEIYRLQAPVEAMINGADLAREMPVFE